MEADIHCMRIRMPRRDIKFIQFCLKYGNNNNCCAWLVFDVSQKPKYNGNIWSVVFGKPSPSSGKMHEINVHIIKPMGKCDCMIQII